MLPKNVMFCSMLRKPVLPNYCLDEMVMMHEVIPGVCLVVRIWEEVAAPEFLITYALINFICSIHGFARAWFVRRRSQQEQRLMTLGELSVELESAAPFVLQFGVMPSRTQLLEAARPDLVQAVKVGAPWELTYSHLAPI